MKTYLILLAALLTFASCSRKNDGFASITKGMTKDEVVAQVGEPTKKRDVLVAEVWTYEANDRTIVFRNGEVYNVMTSANARIDSIEMALKQTGDDVADKLRSAGDTIDSASLRLKQRVTRERDTIK